MLQPGNTRKLTPSEATFGQGGKGSWWINSFLLLFQVDKPEAEPTQFRKRHPGKLSPSSPGW